VLAGFLGSGKKDVCSVQEMLLDSFGHSELIPFCHSGWWLVLLLTGLVSCEIVLSHLNAIFKSVCLQT